MTTSTTVITICILIGISIAAGIVIGIYCNKIYTLNKLTKIYDKAYEELKEALKYDKNNPEDVEKINAMTPQEFVDYKNNFNEAYGRCIMVGDIINIFRK